MHVDKTVNSSNNKIGSTRQRNWDDRNVVLAKDQVRAAASRFGAKRRLLRTMASQQPKSATTTSSVKDNIPATNKEKYSNQQLFEGREDFDESKQTPVKLSNGDTAERSVSAPASAYNRSSLERSIRKAKHYSRTTASKQITVNAEIEQDGVVSNQDEIIKSQNDNDDDPHCRFRSSNTGGLVSMMAQKFEKPSESKIPRKRFSTGEVSKRRERFQKLTGMVKSESHIIHEDREEITHHQYYNNNDEEDNKQYEEDNDIAHTTVADKKKLLEKAFMKIDLSAGKCTNRVRGNSVTNDCQGGYDRIEDRFPLDEGIQTEIDPPIEECTRDSPVSDLKRESDKAKKFLTEVHAKINENTRDSSVSELSVSELKRKDDSIIRESNNAKRFFDILHGKATESQNGPMVSTKMDPDRVTRIGDEPIPALASSEKEYTDMKDKDDLSRFSTPSKPTTQEGFSPPSKPARQQGFSAPGKVARQQGFSTPSKLATQQDIDDVGQVQSGTWSLDEMDFGEAATQTYTALTFQNNNLSDVGLTLDASTKTMNKAGLSLDVSSITPEYDISKNAVDSMTKGLKQVITFGEDLFSTMSGNLDTSYEYGNEMTMKQSNPNQHSFLPATSILPAVVDGDSGNVQESCTDMNESCDIPGARWHPDLLNTRCTESAVVWQRPHGASFEAGLTMSEDPTMMMSEGILADSLADSEPQVVEFTAVDDTTKSMETVKQYEQFQPEESVSSPQVNSVIDLSADQCDMHVQGLSDTLTNLSMEFEPAIDEYGLMNPLMPSLPESKPSEEKEEYTDSYSIVINVTEEDSRDTLHSSLEVDVSGDLVGQVESLVSPNTIDAINGSKEDIFCDLVMSDSGKSQPKAVESSPTNSSTTELSSTKTTHEQDYHSGTTKINQCASTTPTKLKNQENSKGDNDTKDKAQNSNSRVENSPVVKASNLSPSWEDGTSVLTMLNESYQEFVSPSRIAVTNAVNFNDTGTSSAAETAAMLTEKILDGADTLISVPILTLFGCIDDMVAPPPVKRSKSQNAKMPPKETKDRGRRRESSRRRSRSHDNVDHNDADVASSAFLGGRRTTNYKQSRIKAFKNSTRTTTVTTTVPSKASSNSCIKAPRSFSSRKEGRKESKNGGKNIFFNKY